MQTGRGEFDEDVVDRLKVSGITDPLALEAMQEVVYLRGELAKVIRELDKCKRSRLAELNHKVRDD